MHHHEEEVHKLRKALLEKVEKLHQAAGKSSSKPSDIWPHPKFPEEKPQPSGKNSTKANEALFINMEMPWELQDILTNLAKLQKVPFVAVKGHSSKGSFEQDKNFAKNKSQELQIALDMFTITNASAWIYQENSYYINFYAYEIPRNLQPSMVGFMRHPLASLESSKNETDVSKQKPLVQWKVISVFLSRSACQSCAVAASKFQLRLDKTRVN